MAKKHYLSLLILLGSCAENASIQEPLEEITIEYPSSSLIKWSNLFDQDSPDYFIYVFAYDCYYCNELKSKVISFSDSSRFPVYFCEYEKSIPIGHNIEITINKDKVEEVFIKGTPTLILIKDKSIAFNVAGKSEVSEMIDLHLKNEL